MRIAGKVSCTSAIRMIAESVQPPAYPAMSPSETPIAAPSATLQKPIAKRNAKPVEDRRQHVAPLVVRAEQESRISAGDEARRIERIR